MSRDDEEQEKGFRVKDNRRFDSTGEERSDPKGSVAASIAPNEDSSEVHSEVEEMVGQPHFEIDFSSFIMSLATQALMQLGAMRSPDGVGIPVDSDAARQTIDIIAMLQSKTKGNLDNSEQHLVEEILHNLRVTYVKGKE